MRDQFIKIPFAADGDKTAIPDATQPNGSISMQQGWGVDYTREVGVDPEAKSVDRGHMNKLLNLATSLLNRWQTESFPEWIDSVANGGSAFPYTLGAVVRYSANGIDPYLVWVNMVAGNTQPPSAANGWILLTDFLALATDPTETTRGMPMIATQAEVNSGTNDAKVVTPKKLRAGFAASLSSIGYLAFPTWLGGLILQWGTRATPPGGTSASLTFPLTFPNSVFQAVATHGGYIGTGTRDFPSIGSLSNNGFTIYSSTADMGFYWIAVGR